MTTWIQRSYLGCPSSRTLTLGVDRAIASSRSIEYLGVPACLDVGGHGLRVGGSARPFDRTHEPAVPDHFGGLDGAAARVPAL
jgi:hypothetical protein